MVAAEATHSYRVPSTSMERNDLPCNAMSAVYDTPRASLRRRLNLGAQLSRSVTADDYCDVAATRSSSAR